MSHVVISDISGKIAEGTFRSRKVTSTYTRAEAHLEETKESLFGIEH